MANGNSLRDVVVASMLTRNGGGTRTPLGTASILSSENVPIQGLGSNPYVMGHRVGAIGRNRDIASQNATMQLALNKIMAENAAASSAAKAQMEADQFTKELVGKGISDAQERLEYLAGTRTEFPESRKIDTIAAQPSNFGVQPSVDLSGVTMGPDGRPISYKKEVSEGEFNAMQEGVDSLTQQAIDILKQDESIQDVVIGQDGNVLIIDNKGQVTPLSPE